MKIAIIGAGIAGLGLAIGLQRAGIAYSIHERAGRLGQDGFGFMLRQNGFDALAALGADVMPEVAQAGQWLRQATLLDPSGNVTLDQALDGALVIRRAALIACLMRHVPAESVTMQHQFVGFDLDDHGRAVAARFDDGQRVEADVFIACDGLRSRVRQILFPETQLEPVRVTELVSIVHHPEVAAIMAGRFVKTHNEQGGLSIGLVPCGDERVIWYMQFDGRYPLADDASDQERQAFAQRLVGDWPDPIGRLLQKSDWGSTYIWRTTDMDALPAMHKGNVVLLGDAAHPMLTFTSQGVGSALEDAGQLCALLSSGMPDEAALTAFSAARLAAIAPVRAMGRDLAQQFLVPDPTLQRTVPLLK